MSTLREQARMAICSCYYYELVDDLNEADKSELQQIIDNPYIGHFAYGDGLEDCPDWQASQNV